MTRLRGWAPTAALTLIIVATAGAASAQDAGSGVRVTFSGELRVYGIAINNMTDFRDTRSDTGNCLLANCKDNANVYSQRWRLFTTVESADLRARVVWGIEVGDIIWGLGGGASGLEYRGCEGSAPTVPATVTVPGAAPGSTVPVRFGTPSGDTRVGPGSGGCLGSDGVNVETKYLYLQFDVPWVKGMSALVGGHEILFLDSPVGGFFNDDAFGLQLSWEAEPFSVRLTTFKAGEGSRSDADDNDFYMARVGVQVTRDVSFTVEGLLANTQCFAGPTEAGPCVSADLGDTFWVGGTVGAQLGVVRLDGTVVYGQRRMFCPACASSAATERGWGAQLVARAPLGQWNLWGQGWYTTGDERRGTGAFATVPVLEGDSDKLPVPVSGASWNSGRLMAEWLFGASSLGAPAGGAGGFTPNYADSSGTYGVGASAVYALTPALSVGAGVAYVGASRGRGLFGDYVVEVDAGIYYQFNANLSLTLLGGYLIPEQGDGAYNFGFRTRFLF